MNPTQLAIFDIDGTLLPGESQRVFMKFMVREGYVSYLRYLLLVPWFIAYKLRIVTDARKPLAFALQPLRGMRVETFRGAIRTFVEREIIPLLFPKGLDEIHRCRAEGKRILLLSAAISPLVEAIAASVGAEMGKGTELEVVDGAFTGNVTGQIMRGEEKQKAARGFAAQFNAQLADAAAYGDHYSDVPLLSSVGTPVAVNPDKKLTAHAVAAGWRILRTA